MKNDSEKMNTAVENNFSFKKVMRGYDPAEVTAYIEEMSRTMQDASKNFEMRMAEMKQELTLVNRERDNLRERCTELEAKSAIPAPAPEPEPVPEPVPEKPKRGRSQQAQIDSLKKQLDEEQKAGEKTAKSLNKANEQIELLTAQLEDKEKQLESSIQRAEELESRTQKQDSFRDKYEEALAKIENMKADYDSLLSEKDLLAAESEATEKHLKKTEDENSSLKTDLGRLNIENALLQEKNEQYRNELSGLKAEAKEKAYAYAERLAKGEDALSQEKLKLQKKLQMQSYHIEQANAAVEELKKQLDQIMFSSED